MNNNTNTDSHLNLVADLVMNTLLPKQTHYVEITLDTGPTFRCNSIHMDATNLVMNHDKRVNKILIDRVKSVRFVHRVQYPELPVWYRVPPKSDALGWTMTNIRAVLNNLQQLTKHTQPGITSYVTTLPLVLSTRFNSITTDECLILYMSAAWSELPVYIRHSFLDELYRQYVVMNQFYGVTAEYNRIYMHSYSERNTPVGIRTPRQTSVSGGPVVYHDCREE